MSPVAFAPTTPQEAVARALLHVGRGHWDLGGGAPYTAESPFSITGNPKPGRVDCSGFGAWCLRYLRGPWNTDAIIRDARGQTKRWRLVARSERVRPSDVIIMPGLDRDGDGDRDIIGHYGVIVGVDPDFVRGGREWWQLLQVCHASSRRQSELGAIRVTDATIWAGRSYIIRALHIVDGESR